MSKFILLQYTKSSMQQFFYFNKKLRIIETTNMSDTVING